MKVASIRLLAILSLLFLGTPSAYAQCVDCYSFDTCGPAGGNGWRRCQFFGGSCVVSGYCQGARLAGAVTASLNVDERRFTEYKTVQAPMAASQWSTLTQGVDHPMCVEQEGDAHVDVVLAQYTASAKLSLNAEAAMLIQLAQVSPIAAHMAWVLAKNRAWDVSDLELGAAKLRAYSPAQIMQLVSNQEVVADGAGESTSTIGFRGQGVSANTFTVRLFSPNLVDMVLEYRRPDAHGSFRLASWQ